jgi:ABC-type antimicrobial peptide transport system ATPase subunit
MPAKSDRVAGDAAATAHVTDLPACAFAPRCAYRQPRCVTEAPRLRPVGTEARNGGHLAACHFAETVLTEPRHPDISHDSGETR